MSDPDDVDVPLLDALAERDLVFVREDQRHSLVVDHEGRRVMVAFTDREVLATWWVQRGAPESEPPPIAEMPFRQMVALWAVEGVDLLVDPGPGGGVLVSIAAARRHLGYGPLVPEPDSTEPLPFVGFSGGRQSVRVPLVLLAACAGLLLIGLTGGSAWLLLVAVLGVVAAVGLGNRAFAELRQARRATRRLSRSQRLQREQRGRDQQDDAS
ncbi:SseB family protein [Angustibacter sp. McL0619]|uniref:SseB family protein n=1 Tax=Angustibacter sp. McL0619 TaxID=3415676 RepID=UPI003CF62AAA